MKREIIVGSILLVAVSAAAAVTQQLSTAANNATVGQQAQQQEAAPSSLQAHLNAMQTQAQRQIGQLNGLVMNAVNNTKYSNVLEAISNVGKAIHQQISAATNPNHLNIITAPSSSQASGYGESANNEKNKYQSVVITDQGSSLVDSTANQTRAISGAGADGQAPMINSREQGELLRQDIVRRVGQLQQVVASSMDLLKNNGDLIVRRLLEQMNVRLDQAKAKADRIINEPAMNDVALKALVTINLGLNNLNNIIANIVNRLEQANKEQAGGQYQMVAANSNAINQRLQGAAQLRGSLPQLLDSSRFRANLHQLTQQFQTALNGSTLHQQLLALRQRQQQQQALFNLTPSTNRQAGPASAQLPIADGPTNKINTDFVSQ